MATWDERLLLRTLHQIRHNWVMYRRTGNVLYAWGLADLRYEMEILIKEMDMENDLAAELARLREENEHYAAVLEKLQRDGKIGILCNPMYVESLAAVRAEAKRAALMDAAAWFLSYGEMTAAKAMATMAEAVKP